MADGETVGTANFKVQADLGDFVPSMAAAGEAVDAFADTMVEAMAPLLAMVAGIEAVKGLFVDGMADLEQYDNALETTVTNIERMGGGYVGLKEHLETYAEQQALTTKFQKTEVLNTLNELYTRTKDLGEATYVNGLAMDLAAAKHMSLASAGDMLARALTGDQRGVMMLGRELGISKDAGMDAAEMFKILEQRFGGAAKSQNDMANESDKLRNNLSQLREDIVSFFVPAWEDLKRGIDVAATALRHFFGDEDSKERIVDLQKKIENARQGMNAMMAGTRNNSKELNEMIGTQIRYEQVKIGAWQMEIDRLEKADKADETSAANGKKRTQDKLKAITDANDALLAQEQITKDQKDLDEMTAQAFKRYEEDKKKALEEDTQLFKKMGSAVEAAFASMVEAMKKGESAAKALGDALKAAIADAIAAMVEKWADYYYGLAAAALISEDYETAIDDAAAGAALSAVAGMIKGSAKAAKGGYVVGGNPHTDTVPVMVKQNEVIVPLDDAKATSAMSKAMNGAGGGGGASVGELHVHVYGVQRPEDFSKPGVQQSVGLQILKPLQNAYSRSGQRFSNVGA